MAKSTQELIDLIDKHISDGDRAMAKAIVEGGQAHHFSSTGQKVLRGLVAKQKARNNED